MADVLKKVPVREQEAKVRAANFEEVCYGYNKEEAMEEAVRCLNCKNAKCIQGCPVAINIDIDRNRTALDTLCVFTVQTADSFFHCLFFIISIADFFKVCRSYFCLLLSHRNFL